MHPESYKQARALLQKIGCDIKNEKAISSFRKSLKDASALAAELGCGEITLTDILSELEKPARDPREEMPKPVLRSDVLEMKDLKPGMRLKGTVRNVIDFGAFVDIGVHEDGLVHISRMADRFIKHPLEVVSVGDIVDVTVLEVDEKKGRISLTMIDENAKKAQKSPKGGEKSNRNDKNNKKNRANERRNDDFGHGTMAEMLSKIKL